jgi:hypothetical protein
MKKISKIVAGVAALAALSASAFSLTACGGASGSAEAYGPVHGGSYVGYTSITVKNDKVTDLTLTEVCYPTQIKVATGTSTESEDAAKAAINTTVSADDYVVSVTSKTANDVTTYTATAYYKTVSYGNVTLTYDAEKAAYMSGTTTFGTLMKTEANAKAYYEAVKDNAVSVTVGGAANKTLMSYSTLSKEENGYWTKQDASGNDYSRWKANRDATVQYVLDNGVENLMSLTKATSSVKDQYGADATYWMDGEVSTGATWSDMYKTPSASDGYYTYAELINKAYYAAVGTTYDGEYTYNQYGTDYGVKVQVSVDKKGKILNVAILPSDYTQLSAAYGTWTDTQRNEYLADEMKLLNAYKGKTVDEIKNATATIKGVNNAEENSVSDSTLKIGASQSSARLLLAVKDALKNA